MDSRFQFIQVEGLDQIVVGTCIQPCDPVRYLVMRGQNDDRYHLLLQPDVLENIKAASIGQAKIEKNQRDDRYGWRISIDWTTVAA